MVLGDTLSHSHTLHRGFKQNRNAPLLIIFIRKRGRGVSSEIILQRGLVISVVQYELLILTDEKTLPDCSRVSSVTLNRHLS